MNPRSKSLVMSATLFIALLALFTTDATAQKRREGSREGRFLEGARHAPRSVGPRTLSQPRCVAPVRQSPQQPVFRQHSEAPMHSSHGARPSQCPTTNHAAPRLRQGAHTMAPVPSVNPTRTQTVWPSSAAAQPIVPVPTWAASRPITPSSPVIRPLATAQPDNPLRSFAPAQAVAPRFAGVRPGTIMPSNSIPNLRTQPLSVAPGVQNRPSVADQFDAQARNYTRGIDPSGAIAGGPGIGAPGSGGVYASQARPVQQATQATQARQYVQPRILAPQRGSP